MLSNHVESDKHTLNRVTLSKSKAEKVMKQHSAPIGKYTNAFL